MRKLRLVIILCILYISRSYAQGIHFEKSISWAQVKEKAKAENKFIFIDAYATWCGPCKQMDEKVYPQQIVGDFFNDKFISVKVQTDVTKNDPEEVRAWYEVAKQMSIDYTITSLPSMIFLSPEGKPIHKVIGYQKSEDLIAAAQQALKPRGGYYSGLERYKSGVKEKPEYIRNLASYGSFIGDAANSQQIVNDYLRGLSDEQLLTAENLKFVGDFTTSSKDLAFRKLFDNQLKIRKLHEGDQYLEPLRGVIVKEELEPKLKAAKNMPAMEQLEKQMVNKYGDLLRKQIWDKIANFCITNNNPAGFVYFKNKYFLADKNYRSNNDAWTAFEKATSKKDLETVLVWSARDIKAEPDDRFSLDTYANILYKLGSVQEAIVTEQKAKTITESLSKDNPQDKGLLRDIKMYQQTIDKMLAKQPTWPVNKSN